MKLYKFRSLATCQDLERAQDILETGKFWCSRFWELNDPMEGVYRVCACGHSEQAIRDLYTEKVRKHLCSFSGRSAFESPMMWGYYANGFKGVAIEIDADDNDQTIRRVKYEKDVPNIEQGCSNEDAVEQIMTTKLDCWKHEGEHRYLAKGDPGAHKIGTIKAIYFGAPYTTTVNAADARSRSRVREYCRRAKRLAETAADKRIACRVVTVQKARVQIDDSRTRDIFCP